MSLRVVVAFECHFCYAWLPYLGCPHGCAADEEGFSEATENLLEFLQQLRECDLAIYVSVPDEESGED